MAKNQINNSAKNINHNDDDGFQDMSSSNRIPFLVPEENTTYPVHELKPYQFPSNVAAEDAEWRTWSATNEETGEQFLLPTHAKLQKQLPEDAMLYRFRLTYLGKKKMTEGQFKGKLAHDWKVKGKKV